MSTLQKALDPFTEGSSLFHSITSIVNKPLYFHYTQILKKYTYVIYHGSKKTLQKQQTEMSLSSVPDT